MSNAVSVNYDNTAKAAYRERVWNFLADRGAPQSVLILPGPTDLEIQTVLTHGIAPSNIHAVERNAARLAHFGWKADHPAVRCYGSSVGRACERIADAGICLDAANFDFMGNFSWPLVQDVRRAAEAAVWGDNISVAFTALKGREDGATTAALRLLFDATGPVDGLRVRALAEVFQRGLRGRYHYFAHPNQSGSYRSQSQVMEWGVFHFLKSDAPVWRCRENEGWERGVPLVVRTGSHDNGNDRIAVDRPSAWEMRRIAEGYIEFRETAARLVKMLRFIRGLEDTPHARYHHNVGSNGDKWFRSSGTMATEMADEVERLEQDCEREWHRRFDQLRAVELVE